MIISTLEVQDGKFLARSCPTCNWFKSFSEFYINKTGARKGLPITPCKTCRAVTGKSLASKGAVSRWNKRNPAKRRQYEMKNRYGLTKEDFLCMSQVCEICGTTVKLVIDHDHCTGRVRGRLCQRCNQGIGFLRDDALLMLKAIDYLVGSAQ